jgi:hypothetical protein
MMAITRGNVATVFLGGALVCTGTMLPWMSFFAGLQSLTGLGGLYGRILFASGALAVLSGTAMLHRRSAWLFAGTGVLGVLQTLFVVWLLLGLHSTLGELGTHAMLLARPGPGLFVALAGAMLVSAGWVSVAGSRLSAAGTTPASRATAVRRL